MYYGIVKTVSIEIEGVIEEFPQFFSYPSLEELLNKNPNITEYYECDENHRCILTTI